MTKKHENCPLCHTPGEPFFKDRFLNCPECDSIFLARKYYPTRAEEQMRYEEHNNDVHDPGYRKFVLPVVDAVKEDFSADAEGLDYGSGTAPVISKMVKEEDYSIVNHDPFFNPRQKLLERKYDYIVCCEVAEHFHRPDIEFSALKSMLKPGGVLYCMTHLYTPNIFFGNWYYKNDKTHTIIYRRESMEWIKEHFGFEGVRIDGRLVRFW